MPASLRDPCRCVSVSIFRIELFVLPALEQLVCILFIFCRPREVRAALCVLADDCAGASGSLLIWNGKMQMARIFDRHHQCDNCAGRAV